MNFYIFIIGVSIIIRCIIKKRIYLMEVRGDSMYPTFKDGRIVLVKKKRKYNRGDIVVLKRGDCSSISAKEEMFLIKRVIGLGGEKIQLKKGKVFINDELLNESYINNIEKRYDASDEKREYEVPKEMVFVMGDNRCESMDSRHSKIGYIKLEDVVGKV